LADFGDVKDKYHFGIPFNLKDLEGLTCMDYLRQYLQVAPRRIRTCDQVFRKFAEAGVMPKERLHEALTELTMQPLAQSPLEFILSLIGLKFDDLPPIDPEDWKAICAINDHLLFSRLIQRNNKTFTTKGTLETADFSTAYRQLGNLNLTTELLALLRIL
uniref:Mitochondrial transcription termination factor 3 n=1 Tax=Schistocephalus solidus TaxID=70667 RepID=A0A183SNJ0_SCHSO